MYTSSRAKTREKKFGQTKFGPKQVKIEPKTRFFAIFSRLVD